ncbi:helix-turn-helix domain-containing protein [Spirillospora sp. NPDC048911]|uniref:helix-turn-helix domain-containing protein n=1 Tax=Spirillospora sp. NPDC048911 TaxID=3364527 RepID=UPI0037168F96
MADNDNPARTFFGTELRRMREAGGLTGKELADALGCTPQWISTMEAGRKISEQSALDLDTFFRTDGHFHRLWKLAGDIELTSALPPGFPEYAQREKKASTVRIFCGLLINGLFQTNGYATAIMGAIEGPRTADLVSKRMERQAIISGDNPPRVWLVIDEFVLRRVIGSPAIMHEQFGVLLEASHRPNTMVQIVPTSAGYHTGLEGSFTILGFDDEPDIAYTESAGEGQLIERAARVKDKVVRWDLLRGHALSVDETRVVIKAAMEGP